jgi:hypothetical protein
LPTVLLVLVKDRGKDGDRGKDRGKDGGRGKDRDRVKDKVVKDKVVKNRGNGNGNGNSVKNLLPLIKSNRLTLRSV